MLNLLRNYNPKDVMTERCFLNARRIHRGVQRAPSHANTRLLGRHKVLDLKKFSVYNPQFKLKSSLIMKYCQSTKFFSATAHQKCTLPSRAVQLYKNIFLQCGFFFSITKISIYRALNPLPSNLFIELGQGGHIKRLENSFKNAKFEPDELFR